MKTDYNIVLSCNDCFSTLINIDINKFYHCDCDTEDKIKCSYKRSFKNTRKTNDLIYTIATFEFYNLSLEEIEIDRYNFHIIDTQDYLYNYTSMCIELEDYECEDDYNLKLAPNSRCIKKITFPQITTADIGRIFYDDTQASHPLFFNFQISSISNEEREKFEDNYLLKKSYELSSIKSIVENAKREIGDYKNDIRREWTNSALNRVENIESYIKDVKDSIKTSHWWHDRQKEKAREIYKELLNEWEKVKDKYPIPTEPVSRLDNISSVEPSISYISSVSQIEFTVKKNERNSKEGIREDIDDHTKFRSSWEANIARILNFNSVYWQYEIERVDLPGDIDYLPDFKLDDRTYIEVKGMWDGQSIKRVDTFIRANPDTRLWIIDADMYFSIYSMYTKYRMVKNMEKADQKYYPQRIKVVGMKFQKDKNAIKNLKKDQEVNLKLDSENPYDIFAVSVQNSNNVTIGHLSKEWASIYYQKLSLGMEFKCLITEITDAVITLEARRIDQNYIVWDVFK